MEVKDWKNYLDSRGLVTQHQGMGGDGGDSLNRSMSVHILCALDGKPAPGAILSQKLAQYLCPDTRAKFRRHPDPTKWYSRCNTTSRDQLTPMVIILGLIQIGLKPVFLDHLKRGLLFTYNTRRNFVYPTLEEHKEKSTSDVPWDYSWKLPDLTGPEFWALYIRGFNSRLLYPLLYLFDLHTLIGAVSVRLQKTQDDVINHATILEYGKRRMDTMWMKLARMVTPKALLQARLDKFFGPEIEPPINELYRKLED